MPSFIALFFTNSNKLILIYLKYNTSNGDNDSAELFNDPLTFYPFLLLMDGLTCSFSPFTKGGNTKGVFYYNTLIGYALKSKNFFPFRIFEIRNFSNELLTM